MSSKESVRITVVETGGSTLISQIGISVPWLGKHCGRKDCLSCRAKPRICKKSNATYKITRITCKEGGQVREYVGETSRAIHEKIQEHLGTLVTRNESFGVVKN